MRESVPQGRLADALVEAGWLLVAFLVPLVVNLWASQPFEPPKAALVRTLVWIMVGCWLVGCLLARRAPWRDLRRNPLLWPTLALASILILATALGVDPALSLWGSEDRAQGLLTGLSYLVLFLLVSGGLRSRPQFERLVGVIVGTGGPLVCLGLAQALGWRPLPLVTDARSPVFATLGRSNFLGAYLAALLPLTAVWAWTARRPWLRRTGAILALAELVVIGLTLARGAWLGAGVALAVLGMAAGWSRLRPKGAESRLSAVRSRLSSGAAVAASVLLVLAVGLTVASTVGPAQEGSAAARRTIWQASLGLIGRRPWLGYGPEALGLVFPHVYPPQLVYYQGRGELIDRAHNLVLDGLVTAGALGMAAQAALLVAWLVLAWRALRRSTDPWRHAWLLACLAAVAACLATNLVSFDVTATAVLSALVMALAVALSRPFEEVEPGRPLTGRPLGRWLATALVALALGVAVVEANVRPLAAGVADRAAERRAATGDWRGAVRALERAVALWPVEPGYRWALGQAYLQAASSARDPRPDLERAQTVLLAGSGLRPEDWRGWAALGLLYGAWGNRWDSSKLPLAHSAYERATALAPNSATLYTSWGLADLEGGNFTSAAARFRRAVDLDATYADAFIYLGDAELLQGQPAEALAAYRQAVHWQPDLSAAHLGLARCYWYLGQREEALQAADQALLLDPGNTAAQALRQQFAAEP